jgi:3-phenylpropionate/trans-cinnamate dioxygenase ferredoxin reductase component
MLGLAAVPLCLPGRFRRRALVLAVTVLLCVVAVVLARPERRPRSTCVAGGRRMCCVAERSKTRPIVIVGGGMAGGNAAATLRHEGFSGAVMLISREPGVPFGRPPLSKTYLRSEEDLHGWYVRPDGWFADHDVELRTRTAVVAVDPGAHVVTLDSGEEVGYQKVLIATGGRNRRLAIPGAGLRGIHYLRTVAECDAIRDEVAPGRRAVVVGMGFIGCEVAASLTQLGVRVTTIFSGHAPLERVLGGQIGEMISAIHRSKGVELRSADQVAAFEGTERVEAVVTAAGQRIACDFVVAGVGIEPDIPAVAVEHENGILVDDLCRTSEPDVYAAGDVANQLHPLFGRVRVEHYNNAEKHGAAAARSMLGSTAPYDYLYTFWSDQYEHKIEYVGYAARWDEFVIRGSQDERKLIGFYLADGVVRAAVGLDRGGDPELDSDSEMAACARLVSVRAKLDRATLADERTDLWSLGVR